MSSRHLSFAALVALATIALVTTASASTFTSNKYDGQITADSEGQHLTLHMPPSLFVDLECSWDLKADITTNGEGPSAVAQVEELNISECTSEYAVHVLSNGTLSVSSTGVLRGTGQEFRVTTTAGLTCTYDTANTVLGMITDSGETGGTATLDIAATIPRTAGSFLCGPNGQWTGAFTIEALESSTDKLFINGDPASVTTISSEPYDGRITAENEGDHLGLHGSFGVDLECEWHLKANIAIDGTGTTASAEVDELHVDGCTNGYEVHVLNDGTLLFDSNGDLKGVNQTFIATTPIGINCEYSTSNTTLGVITDSGETGGTATLDMAASIPRTGGSFLCGATGQWTGSFTIEAIQAETDLLFLD